MAQSDKPRVRTKKWVPPVRFAKDRNGGSIVHSGSTRHERRLEAAMVRTNGTFYVWDRGTLKAIKGKGQRKRDKRYQRDVSGLPFTSMLR